MKSKWYELKYKAINLRKKGLSLKQVESRLAIPRSTLSGWFKNIKLTEDKKKILHNNWKNALVEARKRAVVWHNEQKKKRLLDAQQKATEILNRIDIKNKDIIDLALSLLYL